MMIPGEIGVYYDEESIWVEVGPEGMDDDDTDTPTFSFGITPEFARKLARALTMASYKVEDGDA